MASGLRVIISLHALPTYTYVAYPAIPTVMATTDLSTIHGCGLFMRRLRLSYVASSMTPKHVRRLGGIYACSEIETLWGEGGARMLWAGGYGPMRLRTPGMGRRAVNTGILGAVQARKRRAARRDT